MKITVFGATGNVGTRVITEALLRGHEITAVLRNNDRVNEIDPSVKVGIGHAVNVFDVI
jgi:putative NADH-flavin reductase